MLIANTDMRAARQIPQGFTLIELVITFALMGLLVTLAVPAFQHWVQNAQIRNGAEAILNGLQQARAEAVRRNVAIQFALTTQSGWKINPSTDPDHIPPLFERVAEEGSANAAVTASPAGAVRVSFNGMGWIVANADGTDTLTSVDVTSATKAGNSEIRPLRVVLMTGGSPKMCDPAVPNTDTRACP